MRNSISCVHLNFGNIYMKGRLIGRRATITVLFALMAVALFIAILLIIEHMKLINSSVSRLSDFEL